MFQSRITEKSTKPFVEKHRRKHELQCIVVNEELQ